MKKSFCDQQFCQCKENLTAVEKYRFPFCSAFLRPTDKLQDPNKLISSGYHVPICCIKSLMQTGKIDYKIDLSSIRNVAIKSQPFEELFNTEMIGSGWMAVADLEAFYKDVKVLEASQKIIIYAQSGLA